MKSRPLTVPLCSRPSPKLVLIILQLCRVALPLMSTTDCAQVVLPAWGQHLYAAHWSSAQPVSDPPARIISLLLAKLGDLLVPGLSLSVSACVATVWGLSCGSSCFVFFCPLDTRWCLVTRLREVSCNGSFCLASYGSRFGWDLKI